MQNSTGCKINVSAASGPNDFEREIGLVGTRGSIEQAKNAIMEKVDAVVCTHELKPTIHQLIIEISNRKIEVEVEAAELVRTINIVIVIGTHMLNSHTANKVLVKLHKVKLQLRLRRRRLVMPRIPMLHTVAIRRMSQCGMPPWPSSNNSNKAAVKVSSRDHQEQHERVDDISNRDHDRLTHLDSLTA